MLIFWIIWLAAVGGLFWRNSAVYRFRTHTLRRVSAQAKVDIAEGRFDGWLWRYAEMDTVSYNEMFLKFWKPLNTFYVKDPARAVR